MKPARSLCLLLLVPIALTACGGPSGGPAGSGAVKTDGTFTVSVSSEPGTLDPQLSLLQVARQVTTFLYDPLVHQAADGKIVSGLAKSWQETPGKVVFTLQDGVTCSDGSPLTAQDVAVNINFVVDPKSASPLSGNFPPAGVQASADNATKQVTLTTAKPTGFLLQNVAGVPIVCAKGMADRATLGRGASGTGPYTLKEVVAGDHYTLERRAGYTWGPGGANNTVPGQPRTVVVKVVGDETTAANLLLSKALNAAVVAGPDQARVKGAGLTQHSFNAMFGEFLYNQAGGRPGADKNVRQALTQALDLAQIRKVLTVGAGSAPTALESQTPCRDGDVSSALPGHDPAAARAALAGLGGKPLTLIYQSKLGPAATSAMELAVQQWKAAGANVEARGVTDVDLTNITRKTGAWDIVLLPLDGQNPLQMQSSFSGPMTGGNVASIRNADYDRQAAEATQQVGTAGCPTWAKAEQALVAGSDVVPFAITDYPTWGTGASFTTTFSVIDATSIRVQE